MAHTRRDFVITSLAALAAAGCESTQTARSGPGVIWPDVKPAPDPSGKVVIPSEPPASAGPLNAIARTNWTSTGVDRGDINPMGSINRITIHHDGMDSPIATTNYQSTRDYLELIRRSHRQRGWADIGYHYGIDKAGRIWALRPIQYQGAHVADQNENNLGVLVMGNFNIQQPTDNQLTTLTAAVGTLRRTYRVSPARIYTHRELGQTSCPGANLQPKVVSMRSRNAFA